MKRRKTGIAKLWPLLIFLHAAVKRTEKAKGAKSGMKIHCLAGTNIQFYNFG